MKSIEFSKEAIKESVEYFKKDTYQQELAFETLAKVLEIVRAKVDSSKKISKQSDYAFVNQIVHLFPE